MQTSKILATIGLACQIWTIGTLSMPPTIAQTTYPVTTQSAAYPLTTQVSPALIAEFDRTFQLGKFDPDRAIALRKKLLPLAQIDDPVACFLLARTYDWYEFGRGKGGDRPTALKWYKRAADLNYFPAADFFYYTYFYSFMGIDKDYSAALKWLNKSLLLASPQKKATVLMEFARFSNPDEKETYGAISQAIPKSRKAQLAYLQEAYALDPRNRSLVDWYGDVLAKDRQYSAALQVLINSDNAYTWRTIGQMYENGQGTRPDIAKALTWYKKMAIDGKKQENDLNPISDYGKREVFRLICLKKISVKQAAPVYSPADYQQELKRAGGKCDYFHGAG